MKKSRIDHPTRWAATMLAAVLGVTLALPAAAQWKWRDKSGQTQYSDLPPPPGVPEHDILQRPTGATGRRSSTTTSVVPAASAASGAPALVPAAKASDPELEARRKQAQQAEEDKKKAEEAKAAAVHADNCARAKAQQRTLDSGVRVTRTNEKGEREFLDDAQRAAEAKRTLEIIASECK